VVALDAQGAMVPVWKSGSKAAKQQSTAGESK